jgi:hypothetical protein
VPGCWAWKAIRYRDPQSDHFYKLLQPVNKYLMPFVLNQPPFDDFTFPLFCDLLKKVDCPAYYIWAGYNEQLVEFLCKMEFSAPIVIIGIKDLLNCESDFNYWHDTQQLGCQYISRLVKKYSNTKFVLFTSIENLHLELSESNLHIIPWGGDLVNQKTQYQQLNPVLDKNFDSDRHFICLNRHRRDHRLIALSYLCGNNLDQFGEITYLTNSTDPKQVSKEFILDIVHWEFDPEKHARVREQILTGYSRMIHITSEPVDDVEIYLKYGTGTNDNASNFEHLRPRYRNSFVEIVTESSYTAPGFLLTEKTAHSFYACNFPILLSGTGAVQHLRDLGLDMFDDIIDHSYDLISNPFDRITTAIDTNHRLLSDSIYVKNLWTQCLPRFKSNVEIMKNIYVWYENRTRKLFDDVVQNIC